MPTMDKIYVLKKKMLIRGPYSLQALQRRGLRQNDMVWYEGLADWTPAPQVAALQGIVEDYETVITTHRVSFVDRMFSFLR